MKINILFDLKNIEIYFPKLIKNRKINKHDDFNDDELTIYYYYYDIS